FALDKHHTTPGGPLIASNQSPCHQPAGTVQLAVNGKERLLEVMRVRGTGADRSAQCLPLRKQGDEIKPEVHLVSDLIVVAEFGDPIYPGLKPTSEVEGPGTPENSPTHVVLNAENHHALQTLQWSHSGGVDLIYIDPPYNTGNKSWQYNDRYISEQDSFRHSKWLSFMERRLILAKQLLRETGVIIVAIGDEEHHRLRMLMDQVFGEQNFISNVVWQGGRKNDSRYVSNGADYMLIYARNEQAMSDQDIRWREEKAGVDDVLATASKIWADHGPDEAAASEAMRKWFKSQPKDSPVQVLSRNVYFLPDGTVCSDSDMQAPESRDNRCRKVLAHPMTGRPVAVPKNGWVCEESTLDRLYAEGWLIFRKDHSLPPRLKRPLDTRAGHVALSVFDRQRTHSGRHLQAVLGDKRFPFPKDHEVLMRWIRMAAPKDAVVLDFFGGSGTTVEAVVRLNAEDGGRRQCILVTNNELAAKDDTRLRESGHQPGSSEYEAMGVFYHVAKPRIETVVTGVRQDGSSFSDGLPGRVGFFDLEYLDADRIADDLAFGAVLPMLWLRAGATGSISPAIRNQDSWLVVNSWGVLRQTDAALAFIDAFPTDGTHAFIVTNSAAEFSNIAAALPAGAEKVMLYSKFLKTFEIHAGHNIEKELSA
ncbi:site-specific DNA-methyltransferase, partial [Pseudarthrobacter oxydans]|uniref:site-specific DNA-methyltransferase n=1 Tax=Pseudarthrobacter oxydans TaxID=1671 RepID=UPI00341B97B4